MGLDSDNSIYGVRLTRVTGSSSGSARPTIETDEQQQFPAGRHSVDVKRVGPAWGVPDELKGCETPSPANE